MNNLLSLPDDWEIYINELINHTSSGRDHTYTVIKELLENGYMKKTQYRCEGKVLGLNYTVFEVSNGCDNSKATIVNVTLNDNGEMIELTTLEPNTENQYSVMQDTDSTSLLNNKDINNNFNKKELVVVVNEKETQLLELYKSFKLEKRIMPHTTKLLKENSHIELDVFNEIFINASEESVNKKYAYIKAIIEELNKSKITTLTEFNNANEKFKSNRSYDTKIDNEKLSRNITRLQEFEIEYIATKQDQLYLSELELDLIDETIGAMIATSEDRTYKNFKIEYARVRNENRNRLI